MKISQTNFAIFQEHQVKDGLALNFFLDILTTLKAEKGSAAVTTTIKKSGLDSRLMEFFPPINQQQTEENFAKTFQEKNLDEVVNFRKQYAANTNRNVVYKLIKEAIEDEKTPKEIIIEIRDINDKNNISEQDTLIMVIFWTILCIEKGEKRMKFFTMRFFYQWKFDLMTWFFRFFH